MFKVLQLILQLSVRLIGVFSSNKAAQFAFFLFQKTYPKKLSEKEKVFYQTADTFQLENEVEKTNVYEMGSVDHPSIILVHGWNSNAGSMAGIAAELVKKDFHVILFDLPAHGRSMKKRTNIVECKKVFKSILKRFHSDQPISVISHSFGSAVVSYGLSELETKVEQLVYLTCPNTLEELFQELRKMLKLGPKIYSKVIEIAERFLGEKLEGISVIQKTKLVNYHNLTLIHDEFDKILPLSYSELAADNLKRSELIVFQKIGHYRMLWNKDVLEKISNLNFLNQSQKITPEKQLIS